MADHPNGTGGLEATSSVAFGELAATGALVVLVPCGSVEPHGPHMTLLTDTMISLGAARRALPGLAAAGLHPRIAPAVPYGVTDCASKFPGAISIPAEALTAYLAAVVDGFLADGAAHVCLINNHLEPAHDRAVRAAIAHRQPREASVACPLERRWARTLSPEFKSGACHAGRYETSLILAETPEGVDEVARTGLDENPVSLSEALAAGTTDFVDMGLTRAYAGDPARASAAEGEALFEKLAEMVRVTVLDALAIELAME